MSPNGVESVVKDTKKEWVLVLAHSGFHGDPELMKLVDHLVHFGGVASFIETGTAAGSTLAHVSRLYPWLPGGFWSCEADPNVVTVAKHNLVNHNQGKVHIHAGDSLQFLSMLVNQFGVNSAPSLFWLDAHSHGYGCPVKEEVEFILANWKEGWILIDDFKVPGKPEFKFDSYKDGDLGFGRLPNLGGRTIVYPNYHPTHGSRGWCLIPISNSQPTTPGDLQLPILTTYSVANQ